MIRIILWTLFYLLAPAGMIWASRRVHFLSKVGTILLMYILGLIVGNLFIYPFEGAGAALRPLQEALTTVTIPLALPLILFACNFKEWPIKKALAAIVSGLVSVAVVSVIGYFIFGPKMGPEAPAVVGMAVGVYTGGTPNLAAIKMMLGADEETYLLVNSFDMVASFLYLMFVLAFGFKWARKVLHVEKGGRRGKRQKGVKMHQSGMTQGEEQMYREVFSKENRAGTLKAVGLAVLVVGAGAGLSLLITGEINMIIMILTLTTLSIAASFLPAVQKWEKSYDAGMYLVLVFSLVVASMVDIRSLDFSSGIWILAYVGFVIFSSLLLQLLLSRLLNVDADTAVITSVAMINSPLFVPMIAEAMKNRKVIITGISAGIVGYAVGNYLGVLIAGLLGG